MLDQLTICTIATSPGMGAIATARLSDYKADDGAHVQEAFHFFIHCWRKFAIKRSLNG
jgi:hypothetical protein